MPFRDHSNVPKIFVIGFNKCGTTTLHEYFLANRYKSVHCDGGLLATRMYRNLADGKPLIEGYNGFTCFSDMELIEKDCALEGYKLYPQLSAQYPDSVFILNTRNVDAWIKSRLTHSEGHYAKKWKAWLRIEDDESLISHWRTDWDDHHREVEQFFHGTSYRFFKFNIETDPVELINNHLPEFAFKPSKYMARGRTADRKPLRRDIARLGL